MRSKVLKRIVFEWVLRYWSITIACRIAAASEATDLLRLVEIHTDRFPIKLKYNLKYIHLTDVIFQYRDCEKSVVLLQTKQISGIATALETRPVQ